jgi:hypothetical protein
MIETAGETGPALSLPGLTRQSIVFVQLFLDGCQQASGLPEFCILKKRHKSGKPDFVVSSPGMTSQLRRKEAG